MIFLCSMSDFFHRDVPTNYILEVLDVIKKCPHHTFQILTKRSSRMVQISKMIKQWPENVWMGVTVEATEYKHRIDHLQLVNARVRFISCEPLLDRVGKLDLAGIDWVIAGGESGPRARPMLREWPINIRDQCLRRNVPYFFKQWGGANKKAAGRKLEGEEWSQMPKLYKSFAHNQVKLAL